MIGFEKVSWKDFDRIVKKLIKQLRKFQFDAIVGISTGGLIPTAVIANEFNIKPRIVGIKYYKDIEVPGEKPSIYQHILEGLANKTVLLVDDIADSGKTLELAKDYVYWKGAKTVIVATLHMKPDCVITPDAYVRVTDKWVVYPWEKEVTV